MADNQYKMEGNAPQLFERDNAKLSVALSPRKYSIISNSTR
jgi:hypothetical protein